MAQTVIKVDYTHLYRPILFQILQTCLSIFPWNRGPEVNACFGQSSCILHLIHQYDVFKKAARATSPKTQNPGMNPITSFPQRIYFSGVTLKIQSIESIVTLLLNIAKDIQTFPTLFLHYLIPLNVLHEQFQPSLPIWLNPLHLDLPTNLYLSSWLTQS